AAGMVRETILQKRHSLMRWVLFSSPTSQTAPPAPDKPLGVSHRGIPTPPRYETADPLFRRQSRPFSRPFQQSPPRRLPRQLFSGYDRHRLPAVWRYRTRSMADASAPESSDRGVREFPPKTPTSSSPASLDAKRSRLAP